LPTTESVAPGINPGKIQTPVPSRELNLGGQIPPQEIQPTDLRPKKLTKASSANQCGQKKKKKK